ncbi:MAG: hypothetical protein K0S45_4460 [Nitrospira sp.]|jgi:hypothetical protein|nr:hypothetical protein [Nitrospira sp.]
MDFELSKAALELLKTVFKRISTSNKETRDSWRAAVSSLQVAVLETQTYVATVERGASLNRQREAELVVHWRNAAVGFYQLDGKLAESLQIKATYWTQPEAWSMEQVHEAEISLQHVAEYTRQLLREPSVPISVGHFASLQLE